MKIEAAEFRKKFKSPTSQPLFSFENTDRSLQFLRTFLVSRHRDKRTGKDVFKNYLVIGNEFETEDGSPSQSVLVMDNRGRLYNAYPNIRIKTGGMVPNTGWSVSNNHPEIVEAVPYTSFNPPLGGERTIGLIEDLSKLSEEQRSYPKRLMRALKEGKDIPPPPVNRIKMVPTRTMLESHIKAKANEYKLANEERAHKAREEYAAFVNKRNTDIKSEYQERIRLAHEDYVKHIDKRKTESFAA